MGVLLEHYNPKIFSKIPQLEDALLDFEKKSVKTALNVLLQVFLKHGVEREFGLAVVHRHFDMTSEEILVEGMKNDRSLSVAAPWMVKGNFANPVDPSSWNSFDLPEEKFVIPMTWAFSGGQLEPFEFINSGEDLPKPPKAFVNELRSELEKLELCGTLGIRRVHLVLDTPTWEITWKGVRANVTQIGKKPDNLEEADMVAVAWKADRDGKHGGFFCGIHYCASCGNCIVQRGTQLHA